MNNFISKSIQSCILRSHIFHCLQRPSYRLCSIDVAPVNNEEKPIWYYNNKGMRQRKLKQIFRSIENVEDIKSERLTDSAFHVRRLSDVFTTFDFPKSAIERMLFLKPRILELSKSKVTKRLKCLQMLGLPKDVVVRMVSKNPSLLLLDMEDSLNERLNMLVNLPLNLNFTRDRCIYLIQKCPTLLFACTDGALKKKVYNLHNLGFKKELLYQLIMKLPSILTMSSEAVEERVKIVHKEMSGKISLLVDFPRAFSASSTRLRERYAFLKQDEYINEHAYLTENKLRAIVLTTDRDFVKLVLRINRSVAENDRIRHSVGKKLKEFRMFQKSYLEENYDENQS